MLFPMKAAHVDPGDAGWLRVKMPCSHRFLRNTFIVSQPQRGPRYISPAPVTGPSAMRIGLRAGKGWSVGVDPGGTQIRV